MKCCGLDPRYSFEIDIRIFPSQKELEADLLSTIDCLRLVARLATSFLKLAALNRPFMKLVVKKNISIKIAGGTYGALG